MVGVIGGDASRSLRNGEDDSSNTVSLVSPESDVVPLSVLWREPLLPEENDMILVISNGDFSNYYVLIAALLAMKDGHFSNSLIIHGAARKSDIHNQPIVLQDANI